MKDCLNDYYKEKIELLKDYVAKSEELLSNADEWESLDTILSHRDGLIQKLQSLETFFNKDLADGGCFKAQEDQIDGLIKLVLDIDQDGIKIIEAEKEKLIEELKVNQQSQKVLDYEIKGHPAKGQFLDSKK